MENEDIEDYVFNFRKKAEFKKLNPGNLVSTVQNKKDTFKRQWNEHLVNQLSEVPDFEEVWRGLGKHWRKFERLQK
jgi:hypothetical protein